MATQKVKRGDIVYLAEYKKTRVGKKVKSEFVRYLGREDEVRQGKKPTRRVLDRLEIQRSYRAGDVRLLWTIAKDLGFIEHIDRICCGNSSIEGPSPGKFLTIWAINRVLDPASCTQLERWTPTTDLPVLAGIQPAEFTRDAFYSSLDFVCYYDRTTKKLVDHTVTIDDVLYRHWRRKHPLKDGTKETVAYDITSILFFGVTCALAELGHNLRNVKRRQVNLAVLISKWDKYPLAHFIYGGSRNSSSTVKNLIARLQQTAINPGTLIWDRANVSKEHVKNVEASEWKLICGVPKTSKEVKVILNNTEVPVNPMTFIRKSKSDHIYAVKTVGHLFGRDRSVVVYLNHDRRSREINSQNEALAEIGKELEALNEKGRLWSEADLHEAINSIVESCSEYIQTTVKRNGNGPRIEWKFRKREIEKAERSFGKYVLLSTDESIPINEVISSYFEKDFVEKVFLTLKTYEEIEPVRHRLPNRVQGYIFVCLLAYRLLAALKFKLEMTKSKEEIHDRIYELLHKFSRVERTEVKFGKEVRTWYLNVTDDVKDCLKALGMKDLLKEETVIAM